MHHCGIVSVVLLRRMAAAKTFAKIVQAGRNTKLEKWFYGIFQK